MTPREQRFVESYRVSRNGRQAALAAGWSVKSATATATRLLRRADIVEALRGHGVEIVHGTNPAGQIRAPRSPHVKHGLTLLQQRFVEAYLLTANATEAARRAHLPSRNPAFAGNKMLRRPGVAEAIEAERLRSIERTRVTRERIIAEYARIAFVDVADVANWDKENGLALKPAHEIARDDRAAIMEIGTVSTKRGGVHTHLRMHSKAAALDALARLLGMHGRGGQGITIDAKPDYLVNGRDAREVLRERLARLAAGKRIEPEKKPEGEGGSTTPPLQGKDTAAK